MYGWGSDSSASWGSGGFNYGSAKKAYNKKTYLSGGSSSSSGSGSMGKAYGLASKLMNVSLHPKQKEVLARLKKKSIVIVSGAYDSVEKVLSACKTKYTTKKELSPDQILLINCDATGENLRYNGECGHEAIKEFVNDGGFLVTSDWSLKNVIEECFPEYMEFNGNKTSDDMVEINLIAEGSPYTKGLGSGSLKPIWWLEGSSYPIKILKKDSVDILISSKEMKKKYKDGPIAVKFQVGKGRVFNVTSHFYLQSVKYKYDAQREKTGLDFAQNFGRLSKKSIKSVPKLDSITFGQMETAYTSVRFLHNIFIEKLKKNKK